MDEENTDLTGKEVEIADNDEHTHSGLLEDE